MTMTSRITTATPITAQSHIPPPAHPPIHPLVWFIINTLGYAAANPPLGNPDRERRQRVNRKATRLPIRQSSILCVYSGHAGQSHNPASAEPHPYIPVIP